MPGIKVRENESIDAALRKFKRACDEADLTNELRKREFYEKAPPGSVHVCERLPFPGPRRSSVALTLPVARSFTDPVILKKPGFRAWLF